jgi:hypothetical protein
VVKNETIIICCRMNEGKGRFFQGSANLEKPEGLTALNK